MHVNVMPFVEPLTGPDSDLGCALDEVLRLEVSLSHRPLSSVCELVGECDLGRVVGDRRRERHRDIHHVGAVAQQVSLFLGQFHVGVVFVTQTESAETEIRNLKVKILRTTVPVKADARTDINRKRKVAGERLEE